MKALRILFVFSFFIFILSGCNTADIRVAWIISSAEGTVDTYCASSDEATPTALDSLQDTGLVLETLALDFGTLVCKIGDTGRPSDPCLGDPADPSDPSWIYFVKNSSGDWEQATVGVTDYEVQDGEVLSFVYTGYTDANYTETTRTPPEMAFSDICTGS